MNPIPLDSPSRPSMKFMLLIIPTIHSTVKPAANGWAKEMLSGRRL